jgi:hypothetical protein
MSACWPISGVNLSVKRCIAIIAAAMAVTAVPANAARVPWDQPCWDSKAYFLETLVAIANGNVTAPRPEFIPRKAPARPHPWSQNPGGVYSVETGSA